MSIRCNVISPRAPLRSLPPLPRHNALDSIPHQHQRIAKARPLLQRAVVLLARARVVAMMAMVAVPPLIRRLSLILLRRRVGLELLLWVGLLRVGRELLVLGISSGRLCVAGGFGRGAGELVGCTRGWVQGGGLGMVGWLLGVGGHVGLGGIRWLGCPMYGCMDGEFNGFQRGVAR
jgi:hypothetical protein